MTGGRRVRTGRVRITAAFAAGAFVAGAAGSSRAEGEFALAVDIVGIRAEQGGNLIVAVYASEDTWLERERARAVRTLPVAGDSLSLSFDGLAPDSACAVVVFHDRNANDHFDMRWFPWPKPKEGTGVSRNRDGRPKYAEAVFVPAEAEDPLRIEMHY